MLLKERGQLVKRTIINKLAKDILIRIFGCHKTTLISVQSLQVPSSVHSLVRVDDVDESGLQAGTANEETVNVGLLGQLLAVLLADTAAVQDAGLVRRLLGDLLLQPLADGSVDLLSLLGGSDLAGANGPAEVSIEWFWETRWANSPDGLVGDDDLGPVLDLGGDGLELVDDDLDGLAGLPLLQALAAAQDDAETAVDGSLGLVGDGHIVLLQDDPALRVAEDGPGDAGVLELLNGDLAGEGAVGLVVDVLGGDLETLAQVLAGQLQVQRRRSNDDL